VLDGTFGASKRGFQPLFLFSSPFEKGLVLSLSKEGLRGDLDSQYLETGNAEGLRPSARGLGVSPSLKVPQACPVTLTRHGNWGI